MFILKFSEQDCWIAPWEGDPGRTLVKENAKEFKTEKQALNFANKITKLNSFRKFSLIVESKPMTHYDLIANTSKMVLIQKRSIFYALFSRMSLLLM